jgi:hypothetical protein
MISILDEESATASETLLYRARLFHELFPHPPPMNIQMFISRSADMRFAIKKFGKSKV